MELKSIVVFYEQYYVCSDRLEDGESLSERSIKSKHFLCLTLQSHASIVAHGRLFGTKLFEMMMLIYVCNMTNILIYGLGSTCHPS